MDETGQNVHILKEESFHQPPTSNRHKICYCLFLCFYVVRSLKKGDFLENLHILSRFVQWKSVLLISCAFWNRCSVFVTAFQGTRQKLYKRCDVHSIHSSFSRGKFCTHAICLRLPFTQYCNIFLTWHDGAVRVLLLRNCVYCARTNTQTAVNCLPCSNLITYLPHPQPRSDDSCVKCSATEYSRRGYNVDNEH